MRWQEDIKMVTTKPGLMYLQCSTGQGPEDFLFSISGTG